MNDCDNPNDATILARRNMVEQQIRGRGIRDPRVLAAVEAIPRERFVAPEFQVMAYEDRALPIDRDQTISQPYIVAYMTEALRVEQDHKVLEVGTGSGYQSAILAQLTDCVHTVERHQSLADAAAARFAALNITNVTLHIGDGSLGWPAEAPFDRIIVTAAAPSVPDRLVDQLVDGGRMVIPVGDTDQQTLIVVVKRAGRTVEHPSVACRFVRLIGEAAWA